jgi:hypothetical protein
LEGLESEDFSDENFVLVKYAGRGFFKIMERFLMGF